MKRLLILAAAASAALMTSACITVIDAHGEDRDWYGAGAQTFDSARDACRGATGKNEGNAFVACMRDRGWSRS